MKKTKETEVRMDFVISPNQANSMLITEDNDAALVSSKLEACVGILLM